MQRYLEWFKPARTEFTVKFHEMQELMEAQTTLDPDTTPTVVLQSLVDEYPEEWDDAVDAEVTIGTPTVVDAVDAADPDCVLMENGAVRFTVEAETNDEAPAPGTGYSFLIIASRADDRTIKVPMRRWLRIMP